MSTTKSASSSMDLEKYRLRRFVDRLIDVGEVEIHDKFELERRLAVSPWLNEDVQGPRLRCPRHPRRTTVCR